MTDADPDHEETAVQPLELGPPPVPRSVGLLLVAGLLTAASVLLTLKHAAMTSQAWYDLKWATRRWFQ